MTKEELIQNYPRLYHMAESGTWESIQRHGLLSTSALLDLFDYSGMKRSLIENQRRPKKVKITHQEYGEAVIRDQKPMSDNALKKCLSGMRVSQWYKTLNSRVFFWLTENRLMGLLRARAYRDDQHCVLTIDTKSLVEDYYKKITLSPINSGATLFTPPLRGKATFLAISKYPFSIWRSKRSPKKAVVELAVDYSVPNITDYVIEVREMHQESIKNTIFMK